MLSSTHGNRRAERVSLRHVRGRGRRSHSAGAGDALRKSRARLGARLQRLRRHDRRPRRGKRRGMSEDRLRRQPATRPTGRRDGQHDLRLQSPSARFRLHGVAGVARGKGAVQHRLRPAALTRAESNPRGAARKASNTGSNVRKPTIRPRCICWTRTCRHGRSSASWRTRPPRSF